MRTAKELLIASREFTDEYKWLSWWHLLSTLAALGAAVAVAVSDLSWVVRGAGSLVAGFAAVRLFILFHDYQHGAILRRSPLSAILMYAYGLITLNPPSVWNRSHNHHHKNNSKAFGANIGSFPIMTTDTYAAATLRERAAYAASRHPITLALGYLTVFFWRMSLRPFLISPLKHFDGGLAVLSHISLTVYLSSFGADIVLLGMILPCAMASCIGAYLFYAQHNFPGAELVERSEWNHVAAALRSSSYMTMGPIMNWFTGNIGYHHVHHLNARIPFYRLPEAMAALEELQSPGKTSLKLRDIVACLRLKLWSPDKQRFVGFKGS